MLDKMLKAAKEWITGGHARTDHRILHKLVNGQPRPPGGALEWYYGLSYIDRMRGNEVWHTIPLNFFVRYFRRAKYNWVTIQLLGSMGVRTSHAAIACPYCRNAVFLESTTQNRKRIKAQKRGERFEAFPGQVLYRALSRISELARSSEQPSYLRLKEIAEVAEVAERYQPGNPWLADFEAVNK